MGGKARLDTLVFERGLSESREAARRLIQAGLVQVGGEMRDKPGEQVGLDATITVTGAAIPYVSRGGLKLEKAIKEFGIDLKGAKAMDIGASTGGFTDCMLQHGAEKVYAVDVGYGQLAWKLREDPRVVVMERTNARSLDPQSFEQGISFASVDVAFISFLKVLPAVLACGAGDMRAVVLVKPQFEAGRELVGKKGVVRDPETHRKVLLASAEGAMGLGLTVSAISYSPIKGPEGNIEYLMYLGKPGANLAALEDIGGQIARVVTESHTLQ